MPRFATSVQNALISLFEKTAYPSAREKLALTHQHPLTLQQVNHWFINARQRRVHRTSSILEEVEEIEEVEEVEEICSQKHISHQQMVDDSSPSSPSSPSAHQIDQWMTPFDHHAFAQIALPLDSTWINWMYDRTSTSSQLLFLIEHVDENMIDLDRILSACVSVVANNEASHIQLVQQYAIDRGHFRTALYLEEVIHLFPQR